VAVEAGSQHLPVVADGSDHEHAHGHNPGDAGDLATVTHRHEQPSDWGWHADFGRPARIAGWITVVLLLLMTTSTHYNGAGAFALIFTAALLVVGLLWDINRRRTAWRD
jgi:hypothetical protein